MILAMLQYVEEVKRKWTIYLKRERIAWNVFRKWR